MRKREIEQSQQVVVRRAMISMLLYEKYENGLAPNLCDQKLLEMNIITKLKNLGFDLSNTGTYVFKDLIAEITRRIKPIENPIYSYETLIENSIKENMDIYVTLENKNSLLYSKIAENNKLNSINLLHRYIESARQDVGLSNEISLLTNMLYSNDEIYQLAFALASILKFDIVHELNEQPGHDGNMKKISY